MGSMYSHIRNERKAESEGQRRKCPSCGKLMNKLPDGDWYCTKCKFKSEGVKKEV